MASKVGIDSDRVVEIESVELAPDAIDDIAAGVADRLGGNKAYQDGSFYGGGGFVLEKPGQSSTPIYGGDDKYTDAGRTDAEIATNLSLVKSILTAFDPRTGQPMVHDWTGAPLVSDRLRQVMVGAAEQALRRAPADVPEYISNGFGGQKALDPGGFVGKGYRAMRSAAKAMTSTGGNAGDEWVPTFASAELWRDIHLATEVSPNVVRVNMPTNPYTLPTLDADPTFRLASTENTAVTASDANTGNATLTAVKVQAEIDFSGELTEDSIIPAIPALRATLVRRGAQCIDDLIVSGDTETNPTGNVNLDDAAPAADSFFLAFNGMRKFALVTNTGQTSNVAGALSTTNFVTIRALLGRYGARSSDLIAVTPASTFVAMTDIASVRTVDVYGPNATLVKGELARIFNIPIIPYEAIPGLTSDKVEADGKASTTASNNTLGWILLFNRAGWTQGFRRELQIESWRDIKKDQNILVCSFRQALIPNGITTIHTAIGRNVTV